MRRLQSGSDPICKAAFTLTCEQLKCDDHKLIPRHQLGKTGAEAAISGHTVHQPISDRSNRGRVGFWSRPGLPAGLSGLTGPALLPDWSKGGGEGRRAFGGGATRIGLENDYVDANTLIITHLAVGLVERPGISLPPIRQAA
jgi:hypothetical protein